MLNRSDNGTPNRTSQMLGFKKKLQRIGQCVPPRVSTYNQDSITYQWYCCETAEVHPNGQDGECLQCLVKVCGEPFYKEEETVCTVVGIMPLCKSRNCFYSISHSRSDVAIKLEPPLKDTASRVKWRLQRQWPSLGEDNTVILVLLDACTHKGSTILT